MYNSSAGTNQDDAELTMIDPSYLYRDNDQPLSNSFVRHIQQANQSKSRNDDYSSIENNRLEAGKQIEQILNFYRQELKQEPNAQLDCNQRLIIRLVDFIRPIYSSERKKLEDLDEVMEEISVLQALPFIEHKEKLDQLTNEILHLKKLIITSAHDDDRNDNTMTKVYRINSMVDYEQWKEMEEETKQLQNLVETQRDKINELIRILSQEDEAPLDNERTTTSNNNPKSTPVTPKNRASTDQQQSSDFLTKSHVDIVPHEAQPTVASHALPPLSRLSSYTDMKKCPICNHKFDKTTDHFQIYMHVERCFNPSDTEPKQYECPNCTEKFPDNDNVYLQHVTDCYNERYNINRSATTVKENEFLQSIRICPLCQAIFNELLMDEQQYQQHIKAHSHQKRR